MKDQEYIKNRKEYFKELHRLLSDKYGLTIEAIKAIRTRYIFMNKGRKGERWTRKSMCMHYAHMLAHKKDLGVRRKIRYEQMFHFLASCKEADFLAVTQQTAFDRRQ